MHFGFLFLVVFQSSLLVCFFELSQSNIPDNASPGKKAACFALGGFFKEKDDDGPPINLLECEIECCTDNNCNTQTPTLSANAIEVFAPTGKADF